MNAINRPHRQRHGKGKITLLILALLSVLVIAASVALAVVIAQRQTAVPENTDTEPQSLLQEGFTYDSPAEAGRMYPFADGVVKVEDHRISYLDIHGVEQWGEDVALVSPACYWRQDAFLVVDFGGSAYYMLSAQGMAMKDNAPGAIVGATVGPDGYFVLLLEQTDNKGVVRVISTRTGRAYEWDFISIKSGFVLSAAFSPDGTWIDIAAVNTDRPSPQTTLLRMETQSGVQVAQFSPPESGLLGTVAHLDVTSAVLIGENLLAGFSQDAKPLFTQSLAKIDYVRTTPYGILLIGAESASAPSALYLLDGSGKLSDPLPLPSVPDCVTVGDEFALLAAGSLIEVVELRSFQLLDTMDAGAEVLQMGLVSGNTVMVVTKEGAGRAVFR